MATLGEMDCGRLKEVGRLMEVKTAEKPSFMIGNLITA